MLEDALKSARLLHRLTIAVSVVTLVFSLSLVSLEDKIAQRNAIRRLVNVDFVSYIAFASERQGNFLRMGRRADVAEFLRVSNAEFLRMFELDDLIAHSRVSDYLASPRRVDNVFAINEANMNDIANATLRDFESAFSRHCLSCDISVWMVDIQEFRDEIALLFDYAGAFVGEPRIAMDVDVLSESPTNADMVSVAEIQLMSAGPDGPLLASMTAVFEMYPTTIPNSSFEDWIAGSSVGRVVTIVDGRAVLADAEVFDKMPVSYWGITLGDLYRTLNADITSAGPAGQVVTILGTRVPGLLVVLASPIALFILSYYFACHTLHLARVAGQNSDAVKYFAWMPLALRSGITWTSEVVVSAIAFPGASLGVLWNRLSQYGEVEPWPGLTVLCVAVVGIVVFGLVSLFNIKSIRAAGKSCD